MRSSGTFSLMNIEIYLVMRVRQMATRTVGGPNIKVCLVMRVRQMLGSSAPTPLSTLLQHSSCITRNPVIHTTAMTPTTVSFARHLSSANVGGPETLIVGIAGDSVAVDGTDRKSRWIASRT